MQFVNPNSHPQKQALHNLVGATVGINYARVRYTIVDAYTGVCNTNLAMAVQSAAICRHCSRGAGPLDDCAHLAGGKSGTDLYKVLFAHVRTPTTVILSFAATQAPRGCWPTILYPLCTTLCS